MKTITSYNQIINSNVTLEDIVISNFEYVKFMYSPLTHQVYLLGQEHAQKNYYLQYTFFGNNAALGKFEYEDREGVIQPNKAYYLTYNGGETYLLNINTPNAKFILKDLTIFSKTEDGEIDGYVLECNMNNQCLVASSNRILIKYATSTMLSNGGN